jgi:NTE family protein
LLPDTITDLAFESLPEASDRDFFNEVPTSFTLPDATVDRLIDAGRHMLRDSPDYQRLLHDLAGGGVDDSSARDGTPAIPQGRQGEQVWAGNR